jgi:hypothetical protein
MREGIFVIRLGRKEAELREMETYQRSVCNRAHTIFEFSVEEVSKTLVLRQVVSFDLVQVATEGFCV